MEIPTIIPEDISAFHALYADFKSLQEQASAAIEAAKANKDNEITIARDGQPVVVREGDLWTEVWHLGSSSDAGRIPMTYRKAREFASIVYSDEGREPQRRGPDGRETGRKSFPLLSHLHLYESFEFLAAGVLLRDGRSEGAVGAQKTQKPPLARRLVQHGECCECAPTKAVTHS